MGACFRAMTGTEGQARKTMKPKGMKAKLDKWYPLRSRFKVVKAHIRKGEDNDLAHQYRLIIEFPREYREGWFPFELQLKIERGLTNYWCNPFGEQEILEVIEAVQRIEIEKDRLAKLRIIKQRHDNKQFQHRMENWP